MPGKGYKRKGGSVKGKGRKKKVEKLGGVGPQDASEWKCPGANATAPTSSEEPAD